MSVRPKYLTVQMYSIFTNFISHQECMLKSPIVIETLSVSPFGSVSFAFRDFGTLSLGTSAIDWLCLLHKLTLLFPHAMSLLIFDNAVCPQVCLSA